MRGCVSDQTRFKWSNPLLGLLFEEMLREALDELQAESPEGHASSPGTPSAWETLDLQPSATRSEIIAAYREKAKRAHPDREGGSHDQMARLNAARDELLRRVG